MNEKGKLKLFIDLFITFFKIGCFTFGGGFAMIPLIEKEVVIEKKWVEEKEVINIFAASQSIPGAIAINSSTFIGYKIGGRIGAIVATLGVVIPSFIIITIIAVFFSRLQNNSIVQKAFLGIRAAVVALIIMAAVKMGKTIVKDKLSGIIAAATIILMITIKLNAIYLIILGAAIGLVIYKFFPNRVSMIIEEKESEDNDIH